MRRSAPAKNEKLLAEHLVCCWKGQDTDPLDQLGPSILRSTRPETQALSLILPATAVINKVKDCHFYECMIS